MGIPAVLSFWTAAALLFLLFFLNDIIIVSAEKQKKKKSSSPVVYHRICCSQSKHFVHRPDFSQPVVKVWAELLNSLIIDDSLTKNTNICHHHFGVDTAAASTKKCKSTDFYIPPLVDDDPTGEFEKGDGWTFEYRATLRQEQDERKAQCATIAFLMPLTSEPPKTPVDFFTPRFLDEITRKETQIQIQQGTAEFVIEDDKLEMINYRPDGSRTFNYFDVYVKDNNSSSRLVTDEELRTVVSRGVCSSPQCVSIFPFLEAVTGTRIPEDYELLKMLTKEEIRNFLTLEKLESIKFSKQMQKLEIEMDKSGVEWFDKHKVPIDALQRMGPAAVWQSVPMLSSAVSQIKMMSSRKKSRRTTKDQTIVSVPPKNTDTVDLSALNEMEFKNLLTEAKRKRCHQAADLLYPKHMSAALASRQIGETLPQGQRRFRLRKGGIPGQRVTPFHRITDFLLVNSLLAVSETKYSDILAAGAIHRLERMRMPIFSLCAKKVKWAPLHRSTGALEWLTDVYRFTMTGVRSSFFEYGKLNEVLHNQSEHLSDDSSQCAILALVGIAEEGFKDLTRQLPYFDVIFGIFTRDEETDLWRIQVDEHSKRRSVSTASRIDLWDLVPFNDFKGSYKRLGQVFDHVANSITENVIVSPKWPDEQSASKRGKYSTRKSETETSRRRRVVAAP